MLAGHYAAAFAAKRITPQTSLGTLFAAAMLVDFLWATLVIVQVERTRLDPKLPGVMPVDFFEQPFSHSLATVLLWGAIFVFVHFFARKDRRACIALLAVVASHWVLDGISHRPDLPLFPTGVYRFGLGLWDSLPGIAAVETSLFTIAVWMYVRVTRPIGRKGVISLWSLVICLILLQVAAYALDPPSDSRLLAAGVLAQTVMVPWAAYADRARRVVTISPEVKVSRASA
jgi:hypothetical protein